MTTVAVKTQDPVNLLAQDGPTSPRANLWQRLARDRMALFALLILTLIVLLILAAPWVAGQDPVDIDPLNKLQLPSGSFPLGTDNLGRSIWARIVWGGRLTLGTAGLAMAVILTIGVLVGTVAGLRGGWVDDLIMRTVDVLMAFPSLILALAIAGMLGPSLVNVLIGIAAVGWVTYARVVRGMVLSVREEVFVEAARSIGAPPWRLALRHILPNILSPVIVLVTLDMGGLLLSISALSFLGLGAQAPAPEWGRMLNDARPFMQTAPHLMLFPGLAIFLTVMALNLLGDGMRDALDPRTRRR